LGIGLSRQTLANWHREIRGSHNPLRLPANASELAPSGILIRVRGLSPCGRLLRLQWNARCDSSRMLGSCTAQIR
jgi:hypothetical protein